MKKIILDDITYKTIKKKKKCIYASYENITEGIHSEDQVIVATDAKEKR